MKYGVRNQIPATVVSVKKGNVMAQVNLKVTSPQSMGAVMTVDSVNELGLKEGDKVELLIKAISVLVVKED